MTTTVEQPTQTTLPANALRDALTAALVAVATETYLPVLNAVQITKDGNQLVFRATDRYRLVRVTVTLDNQPEGDWEVLLPAADVKQLVTVLPKAGPFATLELAADGRFGVAVVDGPSLQVTPIDGDFPKTDQIIPTTFEPTESIAFKPGQLTDIKKMPGLGQKKDNPVLFRLNGPLKPALAEWTDGVSDYLYLLMPQKVEG